MTGANPFQQLTDLTGLTSQVKTVLSEWLGYDGIILDRRDNQVLIRTFDLSKTTGKLQAVVLKNSAEKPTLGSRSQKGAGLLQLAKVGEEVSIFNILMAGSEDSFQPGTKVQIERK